MSQFGRRPPTDWLHVERFGLADLIADPTSLLDIPPDGTEKSLGLPSYWNLWDQKSEGACVGFGSSSMMGITNTFQSKSGGVNQTFRYAPFWLYNEAQLADEWPDTPPEEGTSVRAAMDVLRNKGHRLVRRGKTYPESLEHGISANRWAVNINEIRASVSAGLAVSIGTNWYQGMHNPVIEGGEYWAGLGAMGKLLGGHCYSIYRMSDRRQAFRIMNSWGKDYPPTWIPYPVISRLLNEDGEAAVITDR